MNRISRNALFVFPGSLSGSLISGIWLSLCSAVVAVGFSGGEARAAWPPYLIKGGALTYQGYTCDAPNWTACSNPASNAPPATPISLTFAINNVNGNTVSVSYNGTPSQ